MFLREKGLILLQRFLDPNVVISLAYLSDVFGILDSLKILLQGTEVTLSEAKEQVQSFKDKLALWGRLKSGNFVSFSLLQIQYIRWNQKFVRALLRTQKF
jgi:hypothetical protein